MQKKRKTNINGNNGNDNSKRKKKKQFFVKEQFIVFPGSLKPKLKEDENRRIKKKKKTEIEKYILLLIAYIHTHILRQKKIIPEVTFEQTLRK